MFFNISVKKPKQWQLERKVAVITGAAADIGEAIRVQPDAVSSERLPTSCFSTLVNEIPLNLPVPQG